MKDALVIKATAASTYLLAWGLFLEVLEWLGQYSQGLGVVIGIATAFINWWYQSRRRRNETNEKMANFRPSIIARSVRRSKRKRRKRLR